MKHFYYLFCGTLVAVSCLWGDEPDMVAPETGDPLGEAEAIMTPPLADPLALSTLVAEAAHAAGLTRAPLYLEMTPAWSARQLLDRRAVGSADEDEIRAAYVRHFKRYFAQ